MRFFSFRRVFFFSLPLFISFFIFIDTNFQRSLLNCSVAFKPNVHNITIKTHLTTNYWEDRYRQTTKSETYEMNEKQKEREGKRARRIVEQYI